MNNFTIKKQNLALPPNAFCLFCRGIIIIFLFSYTNVFFFWLLCLQCRKYSFWGEFSRIICRAFLLLYEACGRLLCKLRKHQVNKIKFIIPTFIRKIIILAKLFLIIIIFFLTQHIYLTLLKLKYLGMTIFFHDIACYFL